MVMRWFTLSACSNLFVQIHSSVSRVARKHCPGETFLMTPALPQVWALSTDFRNSLGDHAIDFPMLEHQSQVFFYEFTSRQFSMELLVHFRNWFLNAWKWLTKNLLSQFITPIRDGSVNTELIGRINCAKSKFCIRWVTAEVNWAFGILRRTGCSKNWMSAVFEIWVPQHLRCHSTFLQVCSRALVTIFLHHQDRKKTNAFSESCFT